MKLVVKVSDNEKLYIFESLFKRNRYHKEIIHTKMPVKISDGCYKMQDVSMINDYYTFDIPNDKLLFTTLLLKHLDKNKVSYCFKLEDE